MYIKRKKESEFIIVDNSGVYLCEEDFLNVNEKKSVIETLDLGRTRDVCDFFDSGNTIDPNV